MRSWPGCSSERLSGSDAILEDETITTSLLAIQGPLSAGILASLTELDLAGLRNYAATEAVVAGLPALVARTGYTGEDGFELFPAWDDGPAMWSALLEAGDRCGPAPVWTGSARHAAPRGRHAALRP